MKLYLSIFLIHSFLWPLVFLLFDETSNAMPVIMRVVILYLIFGFIFLSAGLFIYRLLTNKTATTDVFIFGVTSLNVLLFITNPGNLITNFLG